MKKYFLFGALAVATFANAVSFQAPQKVSYASDVKKIETVPTPFEWKDAATFMKEHEGVRAAQAAEYDLADWYDATGVFHLGIYEGLGGYAMALFQFPYLDSVVYYNYYGATNWIVNGEVEKENSDEYVTAYGVIPDGYIGYMPSTADHTFNPSKDWGREYKDTTLNVKGTLYGEAGASYQYVFSASVPKWLNGENSYLTLCAMETDELYEPDGSSKGSDFWMVGAASLGDVYYNGTGVHISKGDKATADTLGILVDNRGTMKIEQILFPIYNNDRSANLIPDGAQLRVAIFPMDEDGIHFSDTIASTVMTNADFVSAGTGYEWVGTLHAKFYDTDIFGSVSQVPVWVNGGFYLQLTNFNETGCDFGIYSDYHCPSTGTTVYQHDGKFSYRGGKGGGGSYGQNLGVSFDAYWPTLVNDTNVYVLNAGVEEGLAYYGDDTENSTILLWTNVNPNDWEVESDADWISYDFSDEYFESDAAGLLAFAAEALPEGVTGRRAIVSVYADGAILEFTINQGEVLDAVENTKVDARFDGKTYNMVGVEVGDDYKGVVIRNGEKFVR